MRHVALTLLCAALGACTTPPRPPKLPPPQVAMPGKFAAALAKGDAAWRAGHGDEALYAYLIAEKLDPQSDVALLRIGALHESLGHDELAIRAWQMAAERNERSGLTRQRLGYAWLQHADVSQAEAEFVRALQLDARLWRASMGLGLVAETRGDYAAARLHYDTALALRPNAGDLLTYSARVALAQDDLDRTRADLGAALATDPQPETWLVLGDLLAHAGDYPGGLEAYHKTLSEAEAYQRLGEQATRAGDHVRAVWYFERAAAASPTYFERAHKSLAVARERSREQQNEAAVR
jgi:protein O-GlcNAc transferase